MKLIAWLFTIKSQSGDVYLWSTREITPYDYSCGRDAAHIADAFSWGGNAEDIASKYSSGRSSDAIICGVYTAKILPVSFNGINLTLIDNIGKLEQITFSIIDQALDVSDFTDCKCVVSMSLDGIIKESWDFKIYNCYRENEKVTFLLKDWLYDLIQCEFPSNSGMTKYYRIMKKTIAHHLFLAIPTMNCLLFGLIPCILLAARQNILHKIFVLAAMQKTLLRRFMNRQHILTVMQLVMIRLTIPYTRSKALKAQM